MLCIQHKTIGREDWPRILERETAYMPINLPALRGMACLLHLKKAKSPLVSNVFGDDMTILDNGYTWLQIAPEDQHWWLSVMFDTAGKLVQYYFDVSFNNRIDGAHSTFDDLFLDVVMRADGAVVLLDQDELDEAIAAGLISQEQYELAEDVAAHLLHVLPRCRAELERFCYETRAALLPRLR